MGRHIYLNNIGFDFPGGTPYRADESYAVLASSVGNLIVTRSTADFERSPVMVVEPAAVAKPHNFPSA